MALPGSGAISMSQVNTELGRSASQAISLNDGAVRTLAGKGSGAISLGDLRGKSSVTFSQTGNGLTTGANAAIITLTCSKPAVWTYTVTGSSYSTSQTSGATATSLRMTVTPFQSGFRYVTRTATWNVTATVDGKSYSWTITCTAEGS